MSDEPLIYFAPRPSARTKFVAARFSLDELNLLDREAASYGVTRSEYVRVAVGRLVASAPAPRPEQAAR